MGIVVAGFDIHRSQITFDALDRDSGEIRRGRIDSTPTAVSQWVERFPGRELHVALEACTGWFFVCEALAAAGATAHLADPAETRTRRSTKQRAKTDREDARWLRTLLDEGRLPEAWIPPAHICELRTLTRLRLFEPFFAKPAPKFRYPLPDFGVRIPSPSLKQASIRPSLTVPLPCGPTLSRGATGLWPKEPLVRRLRRKPA